MGFYNKERDEFDASQKIQENADYSAWQIEAMADYILKKDSEREICRKCGKYGEETGNIEWAVQIDPNGDFQVDENGDLLYVAFPELKCPEQHIWAKGEGKRRGIQGENQIIFENHIKDRRRREIYTSLGTPDPSIQRGIYNRIHPQGRKVNTDEQRKKHGAGWYK